LATKIILPKLGLTMEEGKLVKWLVEEGSRVSRGQPIAELETDKITTEIEAPADGFLGRLVAQAGQTVAVSEVIGWILESVDEVLEVEAAEPAVEGVPAVAESAASSVTEAAAIREPEPSRRATLGRIKASPGARRLAQEARLDLGSVKGSGPGGRIVRRDVEQALAGRDRMAPPASQVPVQPVSVSAKVTSVIPMSGVRAVIAERMSQSHRTTARVTLTTEADAAELVVLREKLSAEAESRGEGAISYSDLLVKIVATALRSYPAINATLVGNQIRLLSDINVGVAVDSESGLLVPVIRGADRKSILEIARDSRDLIGRARSGASLPDDLCGGTFTITNLGTFGIDAFTPIINLPECAILGVGRIREKPVAREGAVVIRSMVWLSLTFDHRLVDGAPAARFLEYVAGLAERPCALLS
jgi:pyruvate dehydrogenase E2 component (dihydrolipoamide acetyltransferase)